VLSRVDIPVRLGEDSGVVVQATVVERDSQWNLLRAEFPGGELWIPDGGDALDEKIRIRILARDVSLALQSHDDSSIVNRLQAEVVEIKDDVDGAMALVKLRIDSTLLLARISRRSVHHISINPGSRVWAQIKSVAIQR
jgi:molybdate transport system ATP-binding protein